MLCILLYQAYLYARNHRLCHDVGAVSFLSTSAIAHNEGLRRLIALLFR